MNLFFELLQVALFERERLSRTPSEKEWEELFTISSEQAVVGITLAALDRMECKEMRPPTTILLEWIGVGEQIRDQNKLLNRRCGDVTKLFADAGFRSCILKGQGNALMYQVPELRMSGDIDIWVEGEKDKIEHFVKSKCPNAIDSEMHWDFPIYDDVTVEVHYKPRYSNTSKYERRLQKWFTEQSNEQFSNVIYLENSEICVPTVKFNAVQQLSHMMGHFFSEGIGFRQLIDYYYLLKKIREENVSDDFVSLFDHLGMLRFSSGIMWIEKEILGLNEQFLISPVSERIGKIILECVIDGGNFGQYRKGNGRIFNIFERAMVDSYRLLKIASVQPSEAFSRLKRKICNTSSLKIALRRMIGKY